MDRFSKRNSDGISGYRPHLGGGIHDLIFSFHMPMFFILSGMTYNWSDNYSDFITSSKKSAKHLLVPALVIYTLTAVIILVQEFSEINSLRALRFFLQKQILRLVFASGNPIVYGKEEIPGLGMTWFLVALFVSREIHDFVYINTLKINRQTSYWTTLLSLWLFGIIISRIQFLPLCLDVCFTILPLYAVSIIYRKAMYEEFPLLRMVLIGTGWIVSFFITRKFGGFFSFAGRHYPLYIGAFFCAICGSILFCEICKILQQQKTVMKPLFIIGKYSLYFFIAHALDMYLPFWSPNSSNWLDLLKRFTFDILLFCLILYHFRTCLHKVHGVTKSPE